MSALEQKIPEGFKQTDIGIIPDDWDVVYLNDISEKVMVGIASAATHAYRNKGIPFLRNQNILPNKLDDTDTLFITPEYEATFQNKRLKTGDLLTARTGYPGTTCMVPEKYNGAQSFTTLITRLKKSTSNPMYVSAYMNSEAGEKFFELNQIGGGQKNVNSAILKRLPLPFPCIKEQTAIANALSDVDALLTEMEKLIAKKQAIKTATMQQLLTGKTRLPQFSRREDGRPKGTKQSELGEIPEDWEVNKISDISTVDPENLGAGTPPEYEFEYISLEQVDTGKLTGTIHYKFKDAPSRARRVLKQGDVLLSTVRPNLKSHLFVNNEVRNLVCSTGFSVIRSVNSKSCSGFIFHHLFCHIINNQIEMLISGSNYPAINSNDVKNLKIAIPPKEEQTAIATILSDMDNEIQSLEQRLAKTRQIKQGMMQELLTGRTRLQYDKE